MALSAFPAEEVAHYVHGTLERFSQQAVKVVTQRFDREMRTMGVGPQLIELDYDDGDDVFLLDCHNSLGQVLDSLLGKIIDDFVVQELEEADAGERDPLVTRFADSLLGEELTRLDLHSDDGHGPAAHDPSAVAKKELHVVNFTGIGTCGKAKFFSLRELPPALQLRARHQSWLENGDHPLATLKTLRHVRWDERRQEHCFGGLPSIPLPRLELEQDLDLEALLELTSFQPLAKGRKRAIVPPDDTEPAQLTHWEFVGEEPTVDQWLNHMGRTRQVDPRDKPEMRTDAARFAGGASVQQPAAGRIRVPQGVPFAQLQNDSEDSEGEEPEQRKTDAFAALMQGNAPADSASETSSASERSSSSGRPTSFGALLSGEPKQAVVRARPRSPVLQASEVSTVVARESQQMVPVVTQPSDTASMASFPTYNRRYANIDSNGLMGDAANQAQWELENPAPQSAPPRRTRTRDDVRRTRQTTESTSMSISEGRDVNQWRSSEPSTTPMNYTETQLGGNESWAGNVVRSDATVQSGSLVDTSAPVTSHTAFPPLTSRTLRRGGETIRQEPLTGNLIDISTPSEDGNRQERPMPRRTSQTLTPQPRTRNSRAAASGDSDSIVETVREDSEAAPPRLHRTMRQRAQKKGKKYKKPSKSRTVQAQLEMPDPPPTPSIARAARPQPPVIPSTPSDSFASAIQSAAFTNAPLRIQFGMVMLEPTKLSNKAWRRGELQEAFDATHSLADFSKALTTSNVDARHLLDLSQAFTSSTDQPIGLADAFSGSGESALDSALAYELDIVDASGQIWSVFINAEQSDDMTIVKKNADQDSVYIHIPFFVWDAKVTRAECRENNPPKTLSADLRSAIHAFANDMTTPLELRTQKRFGEPGFEADVSDLFMVQRARALRTLTRRMPLGGASPAQVSGSHPTAQWNVTQVWDLYIQSGPTVLALTKPRNDKVAPGRMWWEAAMVYSDDDLTIGSTQNTDDEDSAIKETANDAANRLEETIVKIVEKLDNVGAVEQDSVVAVPKSAGKGKGKGKEKAKQSSYVPYW